LDSCASAAEPRVGGIYINLGVAFAMAVLGLNLDSTHCNTPAFAFYYSLPYPLLALTFFFLSSFFLYHSLHSSLIDHQALAPTVALLNNSFSILTI
jgi:hypothetical protein